MINQNENQNNDSNENQVNQDEIEDIYPYIIDKKKIITFINQT